MRASVLAIALLACASSRPAPPPATSAAAPVSAAAAPDEPVPAVQLPDDVTPRHYAIALEIDPERPGFSGEIAIQVALARPRTVIWLNGRDLRVRSADVVPEGGAPVAARYEQLTPDGVARLVLGAPVGPGPARIRMSWEAAYGDLAGLYVSRSDGDAYAVTMLEPYDARSVFPGFDEPRFKTPFAITVTSPAAALTISNGPLAVEEPLPDGRRRRSFSETPPLPTYLVFAGVGPFDVVEGTLPPNEIRREPLPVRGLAPRGRAAGLAYALEVDAAVVPWFERYFGIPFPYPKLDHVAVSDFPSAGMENAGAILYGESWLLASADSSLDQRLFIATLVAHEVSHQWFGDLVTLPWWTDTWLNESFATWIAARAVERWRPDLGAELDAMRAARRVMLDDSLPSSRAIRRPLRAMAEVYDQFDDQSYAKGGAVLGMFEGFVGEEVFRAGVRDYLARHAHGTGTAETFFSALSAAAARDLGPALATFLDQPGVPLVTAQPSCGAGPDGIALAQARWLPRGSGAPNGASWGVPICARAGASGAVRDACTLLDGPATMLPLTSGCPGWVMPDAGGRGYYRFGLDAAGLRALRAQGIARLGQREKVALAWNLRAAQQTGGVPWGEAMETLASLARDPDPEAARETAELLAGLLDRGLAPAARARALPWVRALYAPAAARLGFTPRAGESAATRRLRAAVLALLVRAEDPAVRAEAARRGRAWLARRPGAVAPELAPFAVGAAIDAGGPELLHAAAAELASTRDAARRSALWEGLALVRTPAAAAYVARLWKRPDARIADFLYLVMTLSRSAPGSAAALELLEEEPGAIGALPEGFRALVPVLGASACDARSATRLRAALSPILPRAPEMTLRLELAEETIATCAAEREATADDAAAFFARAKGR